MTVHSAAVLGPLSVAVLTISDSRSLSDDPSGDFLARGVALKGHRLADRRLVRDDQEQIRSALEGLLAAAQVVISTGGTGLAGRDVTVPVVASLLTAPLPGFGELFRMLSYQEIGPAAMLSRALGGRAGAALLFALPGSLAAVRLGWEQLLAPELPHLVWELLRQG